MASWKYKFEVILNGNNEFQKDIHENIEESINKKEKPLTEDKNPLDTEEQEEINLKVWFINELFLI